MQNSGFSEKARWIGLSRVANRLVRVETPSLRGIKSFILDGAPKKAAVKVSGLGAFVLYVNGSRVGDEVLSPAFTDYQKTVLFCEYDITDLLTKGENTVAIEVGAGFFNQSTDDVWSFAHAPWRDGEKFILSLTADGCEVLVSDTTWRVTNGGPRYHNAIRQGEYYDARREDGWLKGGGFDASAWSSAVLVSPPGGELVKQELPPMRICEILHPVSRKCGKNGVIFDFGKNISGVCRIKMSAPRGTQIKINYGERLADDGMSVSKYGIDMYVKCEEQYTDKYIFRGEGTETFAPEFVYHGFQFAEVVGADVAEDEIEALFIHTDLCDKGSFDSSDGMFNWLAAAGNTSLLSNFHGFSEDCPHREKNGWTGDAVISTHHAVYRYDMKEAYKKWLRDIVDTQLASGQLSCIAPTGGWGYVWGCGPAWDCALFAIPEALYRETGDTECFDIVYDAAGKYLEYARIYEDADGLVCFGLGDWCPPYKNGRPYPVASNEFSDCCHYLMMLRIMSLMCELRGEGDKADVYRARAAHLLSATRRKYVHGDDVDNATASARAIAIYYGIVEGNLARGVADKLAEQIRAMDYTVPCGILGMKALFSALSEHGHADTVNKLVHCEKYPSYGFWRKAGATSLWESWSEETTSRNHHMYSEVVNWLYRYVGGIRNDGIAYDKCTFEPYIFADKASASTSTETPRGRIAIAWSFDNGKFKADITVPEGTDATLAVGGTVRKLGTGETSVELDI